MRFRRRVPAVRWPRARSRRALEHARERGPFRDGRFELYEYIDEKLDASAKILFTEIHFAYHCPRLTVVAGEWNEDYLLTVADWADSDPAKALERLRGEGFTHVVSKKGAPGPAGMLEKLSPWLEEIHVSGRYRLWRLIVAPPSWRRDQRSGDSDALTPS